MVGLYGDIRNISPCCYLNKHMKLESRMDDHIQNTADLLLRSDELMQVLALQALVTNRVARTESLDRIKPAIR